MRITESQLRKIIRRTIKENLDEMTPEQRVAVDKEIAQLQAKQSYSAENPNPSDKEFLMNIQFILEALAEGQYAADDFQPWVASRFENYTIPMYKAVYDAVFM